MGRFQICPTRWTIPVFVDFCYKDNPLKSNRKTSMRLSIKTAEQGDDQKSGVDLKVFGLALQIGLSTIFIPIP